MPDATIADRIEATNARFGAATSVDGCNVDRDVWQAVYAAWREQILEHGSTGDVNHSVVPNGCADEAAREPLTQSVRPTGGVRGAGVGGGQGRGSVGCGRE